MRKKTAKKSVKKLSTHKRSRKIYFLKVRSAVGSEDLFINPKDVSAVQDAGQNFRVIIRGAPHAFLISKEDASIEEFMSFIVQGLEGWNV